MSELIYCIAYKQRYDVYGNCYSKKRKQDYVVVLNGELLTGGHRKAFCLPVSSFIWLYYAEIGVSVSSSALATSCFGNFSPVRISHCLLVVIWYL